IAEADKDRETARGKADANRLLEQSITPELLKLKAIEKWNGTMPLSVGGGTLPFLDLAGSEKK
ncbi:MAG: SPFH domain-containing protein, partial [Massilibacteroides sp.]|nr:SPFH domain-containing protein [Massilibacteroides sp.]